MKLNEILDLSARYLILVVFGLLGMGLIRELFRPLTVYPVFWVLSLFGETELTNAGILFGGLVIEIIPACVAGAAYYLLLIFNLATPMDGLKRTKSLVFLMVSFLAINVLRIVAFIFLAGSGYEYFDEAHLLVWYGGSTLLVVVLWFVNVSIFKIKSIPAFSDMKNLARDVFPKKRKKPRKGKSRRKKNAR